MQGGSQQTQTYNSSGSQPLGSGQAQAIPQMQSTQFAPQWQFAPQMQSPMPQSNFNPYAQIFSFLNQQQAQLPQASTALPTSAPAISSTAPATTPAPLAGTTAANNLIAGLPLTGQPTPSTTTLNSNSLAQSATPSASKLSMQDWLKQGNYNPIYAQNTTNPMATQLSENKQYNQYLNS